MASETIRPRPQVPEDLLSILDGFAEAEAQARQLIAGLTDAQFNRQAEAGKKWSIAQYLDHLAKTNGLYAAAMRSAIRAVSPSTRPRQGQIQPGWFERRIINSMDAPPRRRFLAPKKVIPASFRTGEEALTDFCASHREIRSLAAECADRNLNRVRFKNPFVGTLRFTVGTGFLLIGRT